MPHQAHQLYEYQIWANNQVFARLEQLPPEVFRAEVTSVFPSIAHTFAHIYLFERLYLAVLSKVPNEEIFPKMPGWTQEAQDATLDQMQSLFADVAEQYRELLSRTPDPDHAMTIEHPRYGSMETRFSDILQHVVNHGTYHRGNITAMLRQQGHTGIPTDYIFFLMHSKQQSE